MIKTKILNSDVDWEKFLFDNEDAVFVQSPEYGEFYKKMGETYWIAGVYEDDNLIGGALMVQVRAKRGKFLYIPYGPIFSNKISEEKRNQTLLMFFYFVKSFARDLNFDFLKVSPYSNDTAEEHKLYIEGGFIKAPLHILAETTWILNIEKSEKVLLSQMKKNHRNLIKRCEREHVLIKSSNNVQELAGLNDLLDITAERNDFIRFTRVYIENEFEVFNENNNALIFNAYLPDGRLDSSAIIIFYGTMAVYRHSASLHLDKRLPTSYLLQWEVIKEARRRGIKLYNFWGIAPDGAHKNHPFTGITHFKKGFGGYKKELLHCMDFKITWKYYVNWTVEILRKIKRGF